MATFLFSDIIVGPITSRRLGASLGVNLLPAKRKICSFDCIYCECGFNPPKGTPPADFPETAGVVSLLEIKLKELAAEGKNPDVITFAGNGEPTMHPAFAEIIDETVRLRNIYCPNTRIAVLSNTTRIHLPHVFNALLKVDDNILKLDSALPETIQKINVPAKAFDLNRTINYLKRFAGKVIIQTLFVKGNVDGVPVDNTADAEVVAWTNLVKEIAPREVMIYPIARDTPVKSLEKPSPEKMNEIAERLKQVGIPVRVTL
ncbi:MAG: radical SAM protein [Cytophagaceae bacterium]|jgi:wyosine [tRNA(Phe)-imidazoG37] synthetase (radical SAM superfamily)|nr:radical SAM protein [Cytophagaceae bacterium]